MSDDRTTTENEENIKMSNCMLLVNGEEIIGENYATINRPEQVAVLPLLAIVKALGAKTEWNVHNTVVSITFQSNQVEVDTTKSNFGVLVLPGETNAIRQVKNNEIFIDSKSVQGLLLNMFGATINIDYENSVIYINS